MRHLLLAVLFAPFAVGCSSGGGDGVHPSLDMLMAPDLAPRAYPPGPYGNQPGQTLADITFEGYRLSPSQTDYSKLPWSTDIKLSDFNRSDACKCLLITYGARWCPACRDEQPQLVSDVNADPSFCVLGIVQEGQTQGQLAVQGDVTLWGAAFKQDFPIVKGTLQTEKLWNGYAMNGSIGLPFSFVVKPQTMTVLGDKGDGDGDAIQGFDPNIHAVAMARCAAAP